MKNEEHHWQLPAVYIKGTPVHRWVPFNLDCAGLLPSIWVPSFVNLCAGMVAWLNHPKDSPQKLFIWVPAEPVLE